MSWMDSASGSSTYHGGGSYSSNSGPAGAGTGGATYNGSNRSYSGGGGNTTGEGGGLTTGKTWYGNTAIGPSGGAAQAYATRTGNYGGGPSVSQFSNFRTPNGQAMYPGMQGRSIAASHGGQALGMLGALAQAMNARRAASGRVGGLLDGEQVTTAPLPQIVQMNQVRAVPASAPPSIFNPYNAAAAYNAPFGPETFSMAGTRGLSEFSSANDAWHNYMGERYPSYSRGYTTNFQNINGGN